MHITLTCSLSHACTCYGTLSPAPRLSPKTLPRVPHTGMAAACIYYHNWYLLAYCAAMCVSALAMSFGEYLHL